MTSDDSPFTRQHEIEVDDWLKHQVKLRESRFREMASRREECPPRIPMRRQMDGIGLRLWSFLALWLAAVIVLAAVVWLV